MHSPSEFATAARPTHWSPEDGSDEYDEGMQLNLAKVLFGHKFLIVFLVLVGCGIGYYYYTITPPVFQSTAQLQIIHHRPVIEVDPINKGTSATDLIDTHMVLMKSPVIIDLAVANYGVDQLPSIGGNPVTTIASGLTVRRSALSSEILDLSFSGSSREDCETILSSVIAAYVDYLAQTQADSSSNDLKHMTQLKEEISKELSELEADYAEFRETASLLWQGENGENIHAQRLSQIESRRSGLIVEKSLVESNLATIQGLIAEGKNREAILLMIDQFEKDEKDDSIDLAGNEKSPLTKQLIPLLIEEQMLLDKLGPGHRKVREVQRRIQLTRSIAESSASPDAPVREEKVDLLQLFVDSQKHEIAVKEDQLGELNELFEREEALAKTLAIEENNDRTKREAIERKKSIFEAILSKLQSEELTKNTDHLSAQPIIPPTRGAQIAPDIRKNLAIGGVLGLLAGLGLATLLELSDRSFNSPTEISRQLQVPVIGHIPTIDVKREKRLNRHSESPADPTLVTLHRPSSNLAEQYRHVRAALMIGLTRKHQVIQITSPVPSDGKTTISCNLGVVVARTGKKCLIMDCDFRCARVHDLFGVDRDKGISSIIEEEMEIADALHAGPVDNLDILTAGPKIKNPAEILMSPKFANLIEAVRNQYDMIIIDTPPLLAVSDPSTVANLVDATVLTMRLNKDSRSILSQVQDTVEVVGANLVGIVINGVNEKDASYKYTNSYRDSYSHFRYYDETTAKSHVAAT